jgi:hypothetical protein
MQLFRICTLTLPLAFSMACAGSTEPKLLPTTLNGTWIAPVETGRPSGSYHRTLTFTGSGSFVSETRSYGIYQAQPRNELSGYTRIEGTFQAEGDRLLFHPTRSVVWDIFYGVNSPERVTVPYNGSIYDDARYEVRARQLTLHFTIYPADAAEPAVMLFTLAN